MLYREKLICQTPAEHVGFFFIFVTVMEDYRHVFTGGFRMGQDYRLKKEQKI